MITKDHQRKRRGGNGGDGKKRKRKGREGKGREGKKREGEERKGMITSLQRFIEETDGKRREGMERDWNRRDRSNFSKCQEKSAKRKNESRLQLANVNSSLFLQSRLRVLNFCALSLKVNQFYHAVIFVL